jgi:hypothetical protein
MSAVGQTWTFIFELGGSATSNCHQPSHDIKDSAKDQHSRPIDLARDWAG